MGGSPINPLWLGIAGVVLLAIILWAFISFIQGNSSELGNSSPRGQKPTLDDVKRAVVAGDKISAIKLYRQINGGDLKDAKDAVENLSNESP